MTLLALIRHGPTDWNDEGRLQGHQDVALSARARAQLAALCAPAALDGFVWLTSPLGRAQETARLLAPSGPITVEPALIESRWGAWEGETLDGLRARLGARFPAIQRRGLDFLPPGGESPRLVPQPLRPLLPRPR